MAAKGRGLFSVYIYIENFKKSSCQKLLDRFLYNRNVSLVILYHDDSSCHDLSKNMAAKGRGLFSLYIYIEYFNDLLVRNHLTDFSITLQECFFCNPLPRLFKSMIHQKTWSPGGGAIFPYISIYSKLKKSSCQKPLDRFHYNLAEMFPC